MPLSPTLERSAESPAGDAAVDQWALNGRVSSDAGILRVSIARTPFTVGRNPVNDLCLDSRLVSNRHAELNLDRQGVVVCDRGSTNGTFVNGRRIHEPTVVAGDDLVQFADREFRIVRLRADAALHTAVDSSFEDRWEFSKMEEILEGGRLNMLFQPIVSGDPPRTIGFEALVRTSIAGLESPQQLFEAAERQAQACRISELCRLEAVQVLNAAGIPGLLFLNTHPQETLGPELVRSLAELRGQAGSRPLVLELHEQAVPNPSAMRNFRAALNDLQIGLAYDDFGVGNSRLMEIAQAPPDYLKFDRQLVHDLDNPSAPQLALVRTLLQHTTSLGIVPLAEGLETSSAYRACREIGFTHFQGYLFGRPATAASMAPPRRLTPPQTN
jgi:EAL domain-containing protein (putative c-di-GMP-specific phosphodiesterase class I)